MTYTCEQCFMQAILSGKEDAGFIGPAPGAHCSKHDYGRKPNDEVIDETAETVNEAAERTAETARRSDRSCPQTKSRFERSALANGFHSCRLS
jgi:hypothetical protein